MGVQAALEQTWLDKLVGAAGCSRSPLLCWCALELVSRRSPFGLLATIFRMRLCQRTDTKHSIHSRLTLPSTFNFHYFIKSAPSFLISQLPTENKDEQQFLEQVNTPFQECIGAFGQECCRVVEGPGQEP